MHRLVTFGDSYTYGQWLEDCVPPNDTGPSNLAWPRLLGDKLGIPVVNYAAPGASNLEILMKVLTSNILVDDIVIVGWTYIERDLIFKKQFLKKSFNYRDHSRISGTSEIVNKETTKWLEVHNDYDLAIRSGLSIDHAQLYLDSIGVTQFHFSPVTKLFINVGHNKFPKWYKPLLHKMHYNLFPNLDVALDNQHPGHKSQQVLSENLYRIINEK